MKNKNIEINSFSNLSAIEIIKKIKSGEISCKSLVEYYIKNIKKYKHKSAILEIFDDAVEHAEKIDSLRKSGANLPTLAGLPVIIKDNILYKGKICSCGSKFMENHVAQYNATVIEKLLTAGAIIVARANMDEFAMGGSCENSAFGPCLNAFDNNRVSGGSSGGCAVAVALDMCGAALGSDTGGSTRQPASFNGLVGIKPTYGRVSRYGVVACASSFDQISPITKTVEDSALILEAISGNDLKDETSLNNEVPNYLEKINGDIKNLRIGILKETKKILNKTNYAEKYQSIIEWFKNHGAIIKDCSVPSYELALPVYHILSSAEASSNLGRFDGIKYTKCSKNVDDIENVYIKSRTEFFGKEVKRRIMFGNFVLSSGNFDVYYIKAMKVRELIRTEFNEIFKNFDVLISPTTFGEAFKINEKNKNPVDMYSEDVFTTIANVAGNPAITIPCGKGINGLPLGLQIISDNLKEDLLFSIASYFFKNFK